MLSVQVSSQFEPTFVYNENQNIQNTTFRRRALNISIAQFLSQVEKKAFRMAEIATQNEADALDIVQDSMIKLVEKYSDKPAEQWRPLFYKILHSRIMDYFRRRKVYRTLFFWKNSERDDSHFEIQENASNNITPERQVAAENQLRQVSLALKTLPTRQQQCFLLRSWEGLSVKDTASVMGCTEGSVKTHYSRAKQALKNALAISE